MTNLTARKLQRSHAYTLASRRVYGIEQDGMIHSFVTRWDRPTCYQVAVECQPSSIDEAGYDDCGQSVVVETTAHLVQLGAFPRRDRVSAYESDSYESVLHPSEPECDDAQSHDWREVDGSAWGARGGVRYRERCSHCSLTRDVDTWAQNPSNGVVIGTTYSYA